jgi:diguanylate cyclase (GGDEF)-like protein/PAS domain S-box-containing protein
MYVTPGEPQVISVASLGFGYAVGLLLVLPSRPRVWMTAWYFVNLLALGALFGRPLSICIATAIAMTAIASALGWMGRRLDLRSLSIPQDAFKLVLLAVASAVLIPLLTTANATLLNRTSELGPLLPQAALTGVVGILLATALVLTYEPGSYLVRQPARQVELFVLTSAIIFLLLGVSLMDPKTITGAGPLFLLVMALGWLGLRFGPAIASAGLVFAGTWTAFSVMQDTGAFVATTTSQMDAVLAAQIYIAVLSIGVMFLSVYARYTRDQDTASLRTAELLSSAADGAATQVFIKHYDQDNDQFHYVEVNENFASDLGLTPADVVGRSDADLHLPQAAAAFHAQDLEVMHSGSRQRFVTNVVVGNRRVTYFASKFPVHDRNGTVIGVGGVTLDRTEELQRAALLQQVFAKSPVPTARLSWSADGMGDVLEVNEAFATLTGIPVNEIVGRPLSELLTVSEPLTPAADQTAARREIRLRRPDGVELFVVATTTAVSISEESDRFILLILEDVTATRAAEAGLVHRATHDPLTDLLNRQALVERLAARSAGGAVPAGTAVWCCDIDGFKDLNDSLGHDTGDRVLLAMADRVRATVGPQYLVSRLGADEFVVVSGEPLTTESALEVGETIRAAMAEPLDMDGRTHSLRISAGLTIGSGEVGPDELLRQADVALTRAKDLGRDRIEVYLPELDRRVQLRVAMRETLQTALAENRIEIYVQPVVELSTMSTIGAEALVRLRDLDGTILPPAAFVTVAEETGLIVPLGLRVLDLSLALAASWAERDQPLEIAVNVSPRQLDSADFATTVSTLLQVHNVPAERLVLEVTESTVVDASGPTLAVLHQLRASGVHVAIDDFGTGYSSLASLRDLPADIVKVDRSFVSGLGVDSGDEAIVRAVLAMAHATGRVVVAEGVETSEQAGHLAGFHCDRVQGYWFSPPVPPLDFNPQKMWLPKQSRSDQHQP